MPYRRTNSKKNIILLSSSNEHCGPNNVVNDIWEKSEDNLRLIYLYKRDENRPFGDNLKPFNFIKLIISRHSIVKLIHSHLFWADFYTFICKLILRDRLKWISTIHMSLLEDQVDQYGKFYGWIRSSLWLFILSFSDGVVVLNRKMYNEYSKRFKNIHLIGNGINYLKFREESKVINNVLTRKEDAITVAMISRFTPNKGIEGIVKSLSRLTNFNFRFVLVGYGEEKYENKLLITCQETLSNDRFLFLGRQKNIANILSNIDIFAVNSDYEGFPINLLEAMSMSKIIVAPNHEPFNTILKFSKIRCDFNKKDSRSLDNAFIKAFKTFQSGNKNITYEMERYSIQRMVNKYNQLYYRYE